jgi:hypothetical protein
METCNNCKFAKLWKNQLNFDEYECRRWPPDHTGLRYQHVFVYTDGCMGRPDDGCGEFQPKENVI